MKKVLKFLCSRVVIVTLAILVQFCFLLFIVLKLSSYGLYAYVSLQLVSLVVVLWIVTKRDNPSYKIAWIIAILIFPIFGGIFYLVFGNKTMDKKQAQRIRDYAYKQVEVGVERIGLASEHLRLQTDYYQAGTCTMSDLLEAQTLYQQSRDKYVESYAQYEVKKREYLQATGR